ncbi:MAG: DUF1549 domain-containing protein, partial [Planctomycetales bacterium]|nr:DUF1549 domain-containing protein [Planctomycetales bacterium]
MASEQPELEQKEISFYRDVRPILQARCHGCHQPAKQSGDYDMTDFAHLLAGGESQQPAVVAGEPQVSSLLQMLLPVDGQAEMPKNQEPLSAVEIETLRGWIAAGARDDTPESVQRKIDTENPPIYSRPPIVTSLAYSPDGELLAVSGFHEVLLHRANGSQLVGRLVGLSARIESLEFSPDGRHLAVCGGLPERMGELQVWDVAAQRLELSVVLTHETLRGVSWSPAGNSIAVACADNTVRGFDAQTGEQTFFSGAHDDWGLDTVFSLDGSHLVSVGRDMTTKLYHLPTQRFIDNLTSITPGALKGGLAAVARHPQRDEVLVGGADGIPRIYRMHRETKRVIGDDANLIRRFSAMRGRIYSVDFSSDGKWIACGSSLDGQGQVFVYSSDYDGALSEELKKILEKLPGSWSAAEREVVETFVTADTAVVSQMQVPTGIYSVRFSPDGQTVSAAGNDGWIRQLNPQDGKLIRQWVSIDSTTLESVAAIHAGAPSQATPELAATLVSANQPASVPSSQPVSYVQDVMPIISRLGCNAGTCHGAKEGKEGFKLSLRGYDPLFDVRGWTDDLKARRVNFASPDDSLMLLKATGAVPHVGGQLIPSDSAYYGTLRRWIAEGARLDLESPRVEGIRLEPLNPVIEEIGGQQQMRVFAKYTDGSIREVTSEAFIESGNTDIVAADAQGIVRTLRRGEAPILARYEGSYAATILTAMGDRSDFEWSEPEKWNRIDELVAAKYQRMKILPSELCTDEEFIRRVYLDLTGLPPQLERLQS